MKPNDAPTPDSHQPGHDERRRHQRAALQLLIRYRFDTVEQFLAEYSTDISVGGMFIRTDHPHELDALVFLQFSLRDGSPLIEGLGRVVRVNAPGDEGRVAGMGIEFVNLDAESAKLIEEIVALRLATN